MPTLSELHSQRDGLIVSLRDYMDSFPVRTMPDGSHAPDVPGDKIAEIRDRNAELNALGEQIDTLAQAQRVLDDAVERRSAANDLAPRVGTVLTKSISDQVMPRVADLRDRRQVTVTLPEFRQMTTTSGFAPFVQREAGVIPLAFRPPQVIDFLRVVPTDQNATRFMLQTTRTAPTAIAKGEVAAADPATIVYTEITSPIERMVGILPCSAIMLDDEPGLRATLDEDLTMMIRVELDRQATVGSGTAPELRGLFNATGHQVFATGSHPILNAVLRAMTLARFTAFVQPNLLVMHPTDATNLRLSPTTQGLYLLGSPGDIPANRVWGITLVESSALTVTNALVTDTNWSRVRLRQDVVIDVTDSHASEFAAGVLSLRATARAGLEIHRGAANVRITGLPA